MSRQGPARYGDITRALEQVSSPLSAAGSHGLACGMLGIAPATPREDWLAEVMPDGADPADLLAREGIRVLDGLFDRTREALASAHMDFEPLLPPDQSSILERARALADWCDGFLYGLGVAGYDESAARGDEEREFVADVSQIARLRITAGDEEEEQALAELIEYIRAGVLTVSRVPVDTGGRGGTLH